MIRKTEPPQEPLLKNAWEYGSEHGERIVHTEPSQREQQYYDRTAGLSEDQVQMESLKRALARKTDELQKAWDDLHRERAQVGGLHAENVQLKNTVEAMAEELNRLAQVQNAQAGVDVALRERALEMAMVAQRDGLAQGLLDTAWLFLGFLDGSGPIQGSTPVLGTKSPTAETYYNQSVQAYRDPLPDDEIVFYPEPDAAPPQEK